MTEFGGKLDAWLERPYIEQAERDAEYERWCDDNNIDADDPDSVEKFQAQDLGEPDGPDPDEERDRQRDLALDGEYRW